MIYITREIAERGDYKADDGVILLVAPPGVPTVRFMRKLSAEILYNDKLPNLRKYHSDTTKGKFFIKDYFLNDPINE